MADTDTVGLPVLRFPISTGTTCDTGVADTDTVGSPVDKLPISADTPRETALVRVRMNLSSSSIPVSIVSCAALTPCLTLVADASVKSDLSR